MDHVPHPIALLLFLFYSLASSQDTYAWTWVIPDEVIVGNTYNVTYTGPDIYFSPVTIGLRKGPTSDRQLVSVLSRTCILD
jgi:hypothetical protein